MLSKMLHPVVLILAWFESSFPHQIQNQWQNSVSVLSILNHLAPLVFTTQGVSASSPRHRTSPAAKSPSTALLHLDRYKELACSASAATELAHRSQNGCGVLSPQVPRSSNAAEMHQASPLLKHSYNKRIKIIENFYHVMLLVMLGPAALSVWAEARRCSHRKLHPSTWICWRGVAASV
ncbi:hypothetical protein LA080_008304 [Diaporthe eres]|nr:hypothetical protein LA080_008304 [Diaporthe eres]